MVEKIHILYNFNNNSSNSGSFEYNIKDTRVKCWVSRNGVSKEKYYF